jgi:hypothetical protein
MPRWPASYIDFLLERGLTAEGLKACVQDGGDPHVILLEAIGEERALTLIAEFAGTKVVSLSAEPCIDPADLVLAQHGIAPWSGGQYVTWRLPPPEALASNYVLATRASVLEVMCSSLAPPQRPSKARTHIWRLRAGIALLLLLCILRPLEAFYFSFIVALLSSTATGAFKLVLSSMCLMQRTESQPPKTDPRRPSYTILIPMYKEDNILEQMIGAVKALDYPTWLLDIKLILEEDDTKMWDKVHTLALPANCEIIKVPKGQPRTKGRACNYGLLFARGDYVTIFDAEDIPEPDQLLRAAALRQDFMQARLSMYNAEQNLLTKLFNMEYLAWHSASLRGLQNIRWPVPLCGSSNYLRTDLLREAGAWDAYNVTEDAELGMHLHALGHKVTLLDSTTYEEAPATLLNWLRQRTRWIKGFVVTYCAYATTRKHKVTPIRTAMLLIMPFISNISGVVAVSLGLILKDTPLWVWPYAAFILNIGFASQTVQVAAACRINKDLKKLRLAPAYFLYTALLHPIASLCAAWQLVFAPFMWEKTRHSVRKP